MNAAGTRDIKTAVRGLAALARQAGRQADATYGQLGAMKDQVAALKDQVNEAEAQTKAISDQTAAIKSSAISAVRAAQAEIEAADAQTKSADSAKLAADAAAASNLPEFSLTSIEVNGLTGKPTSGDLVKVTIKPIFTNVGGGTAFPRIALVKLIKENTLPKRPDYAGGVSFGGNEFPVGHTGSFYPVAPFTYDVSVSEAKEIAEGKRAVVVIGYIDYDDGAHQQHHWCYAYAAAIPKGQGWTIYKVGPDPYHCQS
ncbi:MAG: hypothetical protein M3T55_00935 [Pseudomonadota bacterium]|nr:hypothetical protein [Pseudomonadota bacterium]